MINDSKSALKNGDIQAIVNIPNNFENTIKNKINTKIEILYDEESNKSMMASSIITSIYEEYKKSLVASLLKQNGLATSILTPFEIEVKSGINENANEDSGFDAMLLSMLPSLLVIFMVSSTMAMAADLGAGEKEKCTFEPLLSTPAKRTSILWGKISSLCVVSFLTLIANMVSMVFSMNMFMNDGGSLGINLDTNSVLGIVTISILLLIRTTR